MRWLEHIEGVILILAPLAGITALFLDFSWQNLLLFSILMIAWKHTNGAP